MCSMIYPQSHCQMESIMTPGDAKSPSCGVSRQPAVGLSGSTVGRDSVVKENGVGLVGISAAGLPSAAPGANVAPIDDDGELRLEVTCGQNQAMLYTGRLQLGSKGTCVLFENAWLTPNEFQYVSGRETAKDWKRSIKHHGKSLKVLIAKGILTTSPPARCDCGQCNTSPRKSTGGSDVSVYNASSVDVSKQHTGDGAEAWRSATHGTSTSDGASVAAASAFRPPPEAVASSVAYRNSDCAVATDRLAVNGSSADEAFGSRTTSGQSKSNGSSSHPGSDMAHSASTTSSSSSSPDVRSKKSNSYNNSGSSTKRSRSPSADAAFDHPPAKHHSSDVGGSHGSELASVRSGEHQSRLGGDSSSSSRSQRQQFSPSADSGSRRREQTSQSSSTSSSSNGGQCRSSQSSGNFKSPSAPSHHHYQNSSGNASSQQSSSSSSSAQKSSPASGVTASTGSPTDPSCVISPLAATPYFPFLAAAAAATTTAAQLPTTPVCYPNPYMMLPLAAAAAAYQTPSAAAQFSAPYGWNAAASSAASVVDQVASRYSAAGALGANGPAFDFPWMRGGACGAQTGSVSSYSSKLSPPPSVIGDPYELAKQSSTFALSTAAQNAYGYRGASGSTAAAAAAAGFGGLFAAAAADGLDAYDNYLRSSFKVATPHLTSAAAAAAAGFQQSLFDGQHSAAAAATGFGVYPPLFQTPYFGIPSR